MLFQTYTGRMVDLEAPTPAMIDIVDIAHHLSLINRFNGATIRPYSVAEHSLRVARLVLDRGGPQQAMAALLHDASEAYLGDDTRPKRAAVADLGHRHRLFEAVIFERFGIFRRPGDEWPEVVRLADNVMLRLEAEHLVPGGFRPELPEMDPAVLAGDLSRIFPGEFRCLHWSEARKRFLGVYAQLRRGSCDTRGAWPW